MSDKTPAWGSEEFKKAIEEHDKKADPEREKSGQKYTNKDNKEGKSGKNK